MRVRIALVGVLVILLAAGWMHGQTTSNPITSNPIPTPIEKRGLAVQIKDLVRLPDTRGMHPNDDLNPAGWARISFVRDLPDGRRFANDSRGILYLLDASNQPSVYLNFAELVSARDLQQARERLDRLHRVSSEFARNGLFYTVHAERAAGNPAKPNFIPPGFRPEDVTYPQHHHGMARHGYIGQQVCVARGASDRCAKRMSSLTRYTRWARWSSTRRRSPAPSITACSTRAAAITGSATWRRPEFEHGVA